MKGLIDKLIIDVAALKTYNVTLNEILTLIRIFYIKTQKVYFPFKSDSNTIQDLIKKVYIKPGEAGDYIITETGIELLRAVSELFLQFENKKEETVNETLSNVEEIADKIRAKFRGKKTGAMGDRQALIAKLRKWCIKNPEITQGEILTATDNYIDSVDNYNYLQQADYFVYKKYGGVERSRLSISVEELQAPAENSDWGSDLI